MSKYTTQLRWIVEQEQGTVPATSRTRYTAATYKKLGLDTYPIFEETYRPLLNDKIIDHFFFREIGFETAAQFAWYMRRTMNEIMPYYNKLYEVELLIDDPLTDYDHSWREDWDSHREDTGNITDNNVGGTEYESHDRNVYQDTPMSLLDNSTTPTVQGLDYATNVTYDDLNSSTDTDETNIRTLNTDSNDHGWKTHDDKGRHVSQVELFDKLKQKYVNLDMEVINQLETLFMGLW